MSKSNKIISVMITIIVMGISTAVTTWVMMDLIITGAIGLMTFVAPIFMLGTILIFYSLISD